VAAKGTRKVRPRGRRKPPSGTGVTALLRRQLVEARAQQDATAEILRVMSRSSADLPSVLEAIVQSTQRLMVGRSAVLLLRRDPQFVVAAYAGPAITDLPDEVRVAPLDRDRNFPSRAILDGEVLHIPDWQGDDVPEHERIVGRALGIRSGLMVPLLRAGEGIGAIAVTRGTPGPYPENEIALLRSFADQAVIAIENARLLNETREALERETAIGQILRVISSSPGDVKPVLDAVAQRAASICEAQFADIILAEGDTMRVASYVGDLGRPVGEPVPLDRSTVMGRSIVDRVPVHVADLQNAGDEFPIGQALARRFGHRTILAMPLVREGHALGTILVRRVEVRPFEEQHLSLLRTFAEQAAIAIENVRLFRELEQKSRQLEEASRHKSQFLASMSHELRTPLNGILGFNEMVLDGIYGEVSPEVRSALEEIQSSGTHLLRLINNVLDLAKIEAGRMELALADYSAQETVGRVLSTLRPVAAEKGLELLASVPPDIPLAHGDAGRIAQCLLNLAGNALKFTKAGRVEIGVTLVTGRLVYRVTDTGIGIPPDKIDGLFTEFTQADATIASEYGGTGLGLSVTKKFVEMHGGRIWVESKVGKGSTFLFEVPLRA
jgi:signal transduction histidine kinase